MYTPLVITSLFILGQVSDVYGRKLPIVIPFIAQLFEVTIYLLNSIFIEGHQAFMLLGPVFAGGLGGYAGLVMAASSYITHIVPPERRTFRLSILFATSSLASLVSLTCSGLLLDATSLVFMFSLCFCIYALGLLSAILMVRDVTADDTTSANEKQEDKEGLCERLLEQLKEVLLVAFVKRENNDRRYILIILVITTIEVIGSGLYSLLSNI